MGEAATCLDERLGVHLAVFDQVDQGRSEIMAGVAARRRRCRLWLGFGRGGPAGVDDDGIGVAIERGVVGLCVKQTDEAVDGFAARFFAEARRRRAMRKQ